VLLMLLGVWLLFISYTDITGLKDKNKNGEEPIFAIGSANLNRYAPEFEGRRSTDEIRRLVAEMVVAVRSRNTNN
jgi:hypothetical protein